MSLQPIINHPIQQLQMIDYVSSHELVLIISHFFFTAAGEETLRHTLRALEMRPRNKHALLLSANWRREQTYTKLRDCDIQHAPHHDQSVKWIPRIDEIVLRKGRNKQSKSQTRRTSVDSYFLKGQVGWNLTWARRASNLMIISIVKTTVKIMLRMSMTEVNSFDCS